MCWWICGPDAAQSDPIVSEMCTDDKTGLLRRKSSGTHPTIFSSFSRDNSLDSCDDDYLITGHYSDITKDYFISDKVFGTGHYGTVRQCTHRSTGEIYAVKSIKKSEVENLRYLKREVQMLSKVKHKNIIKLVGCYEDDRYAHIVTEACTGGELFDKIVASAGEEGCLPEMEAARIIKQLLQAVSYLHANDVVHLDIKPENLLFKSADANSSIRLIDFGFSCQLYQGESMSARVGTLQYMSAEIIKGKYGHASDIWSVGVIAYILLCGYSPFYGKDDSEVAKAILRGQLTFIHGWDGVSNLAMDFITRLLNVDPKKRLTADAALMHPWLK